MAGTLNLALTQQLDINGNPLAGALLYFFVVGTVATPQNSYQDFGLTIVNPSPIVADQYGRIPMFYLADGQVHVRLTDANGTVIFDYPSMQVIGPSAGGGGGGSIDPTTIAATGDVKFRLTSEILTGWVKLNAQTIGAATSGATQRANADTQALFIYLWNNFSNAHCPVAGGRGASGLADFNANKTIGLPDVRSRALVGLDDMGNSAAGRLLPSNVTSGGSDGPTTPAASGGEANHTLILLEAPAGQFTLTDPGHVHVEDLASVGGAYLGGAVVAPSSPGTLNTASATTGITLTDHAGGQPHNNMMPFTLGTFYIHL
jgi:hypothetical protein